MARRPRVGFWKSPADASRVPGTEIAVRPPLRNAPVAATAHRPFGLGPLTGDHFFEAVREVEAGFIAMCRCGWANAGADTEEEARALLAAHVESPEPVLEVAAVDGHVVNAYRQWATGYERFAIRCSCGWVASGTARDLDKASRIGRRHIVELSH